MTRSGAIHHLDVTVSDLDRSTLHHLAFAAPNRADVCFADPDGIKLEYVFTPR